MLLKKKIFSSLSYSPTRFFLTWACVGVLLHTSPVAAQDSAAGSTGWNANVETEAEFAYRSVYERAMAAQPQNIKPKPRQKPRIVRRSVPRIIPALPVRKPVELIAMVQDHAPAKSVSDPKATKDVAGQQAVSRKKAPKAVPFTTPVEFVGSVAVDTPSDQPRNTEVKRVTKQDRVPETYGSLPSTPWFSPILDGAEQMLTTQAANEGDPVQQARQQRAPVTRGDQYCSNIASAAADARFVWQRQILLKTEEEVKRRIEALQAQIDKYQKWLDRRDDFSAKAQAVITGIYAKMRPDAAAQQLTVLDEETAAAVITQLNPRTASAVMAEMDVNRAARLTAIIAAASKGPKGRKPTNPRDRGT